MFLLRSSAQSPEITLVIRGHSRKKSCPLYPESGSLVQLTGSACLLRDEISPLRGLALSSVNLSTNKRYGALINRSRIPCLDGREIGFPRLVSRTGAPAMSLKEICR